MTTPTEPAAQPAATPAPVAQAAPTPPWGSDDQFDAARAWQLIQNQRADLAARNARIAELTPFEQQARELAEAQKTTEQRLTDQLAQAQAEAAQLRADALRAKVAAAKGVPPTLAGRLQGATEEELSADADALLAAFPQPATPAAASHTPVEALRPGAVQQEPVLSLEERIAAAEKAKDWPAAMALKSMRLAELAKKQQ